MKFPVLVLFAVACIAAAPPAPRNPNLAPDETNRRIQQHRTAETTLTILGADGKPLANTPVVIRQTRHKFLFGCNAFAINTADATQLQQDYQRRFSELLNFATLGFYWGAYERREGQPAEQRLRMMADWCAKNGIRIKGHPLCWHQVAPKWTIDKSPEEFEKIQLARIERDVKAFAGLIDAWDVVNEVVVMPAYATEPTPVPAWCRSIGGAELVKRCFVKARQSNPAAALVLNDYDTSPKYEKLIRDCLSGGVSIDAVGIQSHMHTGYWGAEKTWEVCERFAKFGKPLNFTEVTITSGPGKRDIRWNGAPHTDWASTPEGEAQQEREVVEFYTVLFSHPAVSAITWWDFSDNHAWLGAPAGLINKDMSPKPAYLAIKKLIKGSWWTAEVKATTSADGSVSFRGFLGDYAVQTPSGTAKFQLDKPGKCSVKTSLEAR